MLRGKASDTPSPDTVVNTKKTSGTASSGVATAKSQVTINNFLTPDLKGKQPAIELVSKEEHAATSREENARSGHVPPPGIPIVRQPVDSNRSRHHHRTQSSAMNHHKLKLDAASTGAHRHHHGHHKHVPSSTTIPVEKALLSSSATEQPVTPLTENSTATIVQ